MIAQLKGILSRKSAEHVIVDVSGVGFEVHVPFSTYYQLGDVGESVLLQIHTHVREDALALFGFQDSKEKQLFLRLIQISGIGPRLAVAILSGLPVDELLDAVARADIARLSSIPGVGKKTAQRISLELKDKIDALVSEQGVEGVLTAGSTLQRDAVSALVNLGYPKNKAESAVSSVVRTEDAGPVEDLIRKALRKLSG